MTREEMVTVQVKGGGAASFAAGEKYALSLAAGQTADKWADGSPITRREFDAVLLREGIFEIIGKPALGSPPAATAATKKMGPASRPAVAGVTPEKE